jgi:aspartyl-tRNA(Asn)/glutamyl-tRNA(Gln) amidotransferase subunit A
MDWLTASATDLGRGIEAGEIDPVALTQAYLEAIRSHEFGDRIYARLTEDRALAEAKAASDRAKSGHRIGLLDGVPISWKDLFDSAGVATEAGTALLKDRVPSTDADVLATATQTGLVCLGKTHMTELAFSGLGYNPVTQSPPCVNDFDAVSGGSSSGAATSVAFGLAAAGIGSDTGGSVRIPAVWNDLVGLKTTPGRLSLNGVVPLCARFDTVGPLTRSVEDAAHLLAALEGRAVAELKNASIEGARLLVLQTVALDDLSEAPRAAFVNAVQRLQAAGAVVDHAEIPVVAEAMALSAILFTSEAYGTWKTEIEAQPELMFKEVRERFQSGKDHLAADYVAAWQRLDQLRAQYLETTAGYDAVIVPTAPNLPPNLQRLATDKDYFVAENLMTLRNTRIGNLMGLAGLTLPTGVPSCGIMFLSNPMSEERLLRLGKAAEDALA